MNLLKLYFQKVFSLNLKSLTLMRMASAACILLDLFYRSIDLSVFHADWAASPRQVIPLHMISGHTFFQVILFLVTSIAAINLFLGYKTKLSTIISWILLVSIQSRNPMILQSGDTVLRILLFWGMFLPWGSKFSIDKMLNKPITKLNYQNQKSTINH